MLSDPHEQTLLAEAIGAGDLAYAVLDDAHVQAQFSRPVDKSGEVESWLLVEGMVCASCAQSIEQLLGNMPGVASVDVNVAAGKARVVWDPLKTRVSRLFAAIASLNYRPFPVRHIGADMRRRSESRRALWRLFVAGFCMMQVMMYAAPAYFSEPGDISPDLDALLKWASCILSLPVLLFAAAPFFRNAWSDLRARRVGMDVPVALGMAITFLASTTAVMQGSGEVYFDSLTMFVFFLLGGRYLETLARGRAMASLESLSNRLPEAVERFIDYPASGQTHQALAHELRRGDVLRVAVGQAFPADGVVLEGESTADEALLTGEGEPVAKACGDPIVAGSFNLHGPLIIRVERLGNASRFGEIVALMERAASEKPRLAAIADRYAGVFLVSVLVLAALAGGLWWLIEPARAVWVTVAVLVVTCPCALSLATPAAVLAVCGNLARRGVLVCHPAALEALATADRVVFDKTGTLTRAELALSDVQMQRPGVDRDWAVTLASTMEQGSLHPVARALQAADQSGACMQAGSIHEHAGKGVAASFEGRAYRFGSAAFAWPALTVAGGMSVVAVLADDAGPIAVMHFAELPRADARIAIDSLKALPVQVSILSGDRPERIREVAAQLGIEDGRGAQTPETKLAVVSAWQSGATAAPARVVMVGDGINDGPVLSRADVSIVMGSGAPLSQSDADIVLLSNRLDDVPYGIALARRMRQVIRQNLAWAIGYNAVCVPLALAGLLPPWLASAGMAASSLLVVVNALRLAR